MIPLQISRLAVVLGMAALLPPAHLAAQEAQPTPGRRNLVQVRVSSSVRFDEGSGDYVYRYVLHNDAASRQKVSSFTVVVNGPVSGVVSPRGWTHAPLEEGALLDWTATEADLEGWVDDGGIPPARDAVAPGNHLAGFGFRSRYPPGQTTYFVQGEAALPRLAQALEQPAAPSFGDFRRNGVSGPVTAPRPGCSDGTSRCVLDGRLALRVRWRDPRSGEIKAAAAVDASEARLPKETGLFRFSPEPGKSIDLAVRVVDGRAVNHHFWLSAGGGAALEYWVEIVDPQRGLVRSYYNPPGNECGLEDVQAIPEEGLLAAASLEIQSAASPLVAPRLTEEWQDDQLIQGPCRGGDDTFLCLQDGRFTVDVDWRDPLSGKTGIGRVLPALPGSPNQGAFWLEEPDRLDLTVQLTDERPAGGRFRLSFAPLASLETRIKVTDRWTGKVRIYRHSANSLCGMSDPQAF